MDYSEIEEKLEFTDAAKAYIGETAKWGKFLAIVGFIMCGLLVVSGLTMGTLFSSLLSKNSSDIETTSLPFLGGIMNFFTVLMALIYFIPCMYLYRFSTKTKIALKESDANILAEALKNHKSMFKFMGIFTIIILGLYALIFIFAIVGGGMAMFMK